MTTPKKNTTASSPSKVVIELFKPELQLKPSLLACINVYKNRFVSVLSSNGKQLAHLKLKDETAHKKLNKLFSELEKLCTRDANYWVKLPTGSWVRKNAVLGFQCHSDNKHRGVLLRTQNNRILSFIPCKDSDNQLKVVQELQRAIEVKQPSQRHIPSWDFLNHAA